MTGQDRAQAKISITIVPKKWRKEGIKSKGRMKMRRLKARKGRNNPKEIRGRRF
jgi:hypothetical protein